MSPDPARRGWAWLAGLVLASGACAEGGESFEIGAHRYHADQSLQWALPKPLREISGLALDPRGRLFAHDDERARVYLIDYLQGGVVKRFDVGDPVLKGDFEGIAWADGQLYLVTSDGTLIVVREGEDGASVPFERYDTGLGKRCEIEGLHHDAAEGVLRMACKVMREPELDGYVALLAWSLRDRQPDPERDIRVPAPAGKTLNPSGLTRCPQSGHLIMVAARQRALIEVDDAGVLHRLVKLPDGLKHRQIEGVEMTAQGDLIIAEESKERGRLSVYTARQ